MQKVRQARSNRSFDADTQARPRFARRLSCAAQLVRKHIQTAFAGVVLGIAVQTFVSLAQTWSFGPSLRAFQLALGAAPFAVVTVVFLSVPVAVAYFATSRLLHVSSILQLALLLAPFIALQVVGLSEGWNGYAFSYACAYVIVAAAGVLGWQQVQRKQGGRA